MRAFTSVFSILVVRTTDYKYVIMTVIGWKDEISFLVITGSTQEDSCFTSCTNRNAPFGWIDLVRREKKIFGFD